MSAIIIKNDLPLELVALSQETINTRDGLLERSVVLRKDKVITAENYQEAATLYRELSAFGSGVEKGRQQLKAPILTLGKALDAAAKEAMEPIEQERLELGKIVNAYEASERERVYNEQRAAREAARLAEIAERERQEKALRAAAELAAPPGEEPKPIDVEEIKVRPIVPTFVPTFKGVTRATPKKRVQIDDLSKIPFEMQGIRLWKEVDNSALLTLLKAGIVIPGCSLVEETSIGAKG